MLELSLLYPKKTRRFDFELKFIYSTCHDEVHALKMSTLTRYDLSIAVLADTIVLSDTRNGKSEKVTDD